MSKKLILIGIDSMILDFVEYFSKEGIMPNINKLIKEGVYGYALPSMPTYTPTNWATIATGADSTIHNVFEWVFKSDVRNAESVWDIASKHGKKIVLIRFPSSFPPRYNNTVVIGDGAPHDGVGVLEESRLYSSKKIYRYSGGLHGTFESILIKWSTANSWRNMPMDIICTNLKPLETSLIIQLKNAKQVTLYLLLYSKSCESYDTLSIAFEKDFSKVVATLSRGRWSDFILISFEKLDGNIVQGVCRFKLLESDPENFLLYRTQIHAVEGFVHPSDIEKKLIKVVGYFLDNPSRLCLAHKCFDTFFEELEYHLDWICRAATYLKKEVDWDLLFIQLHAVDYVQHELWHCIDPAEPGYTDDYQCREVIKRVYSKIDEFVGRILELADENTLIVLTSDHGHIARVKVVFLVDYLADKGFIALKQDGSIDTSKSIVREIKYDGLTLNTVWRYSDGIIKRDDEYKETIEKLIDVLLSLKDGEKHVFYLVIPGWEAEVLGYREKDLDILYAPRPGYAIVRGLSRKYQLKKEDYVGLPDPEHGVWGGASSIHEGLPSARLSIGTNKAMFVMRGPKVKKGFRVDYGVWLKDIGPTVCALLGIPIPKLATGRILYEIIDGEILFNIM
ncbi:MAG: alkaline phosphatase family protein [Ignisphaera sp.]